MGEQKYLQIVIPKQPVSSCCGLLQQHNGKAPILTAVEPPTSVMASSAPAVARSIAEVGRESIRVEKLRGRVQTVFPLHACMPPTANNSETQDYGTVGNDGPIEGATKVSDVGRPGLCQSRRFVAERQLILHVLRSPFMFLTVLPPRPL